MCLIDLLKKQKQIGNFKSPFRYLHYISFHFAF